MRTGLTIGQAAAYAGVTVKTVRHYHRLGLIEEPERDSAGYRRYRSTDLLRLVRVRTLARAGVPLADIAALLDAEPEQFATALVEVERQLDDRIAELTSRRETLRRLASGDRVLLPSRAAALLDRLTELGFDAEYVAVQWEALVLVRALMPEGFDDFLTQYDLRLGDPEYVDLQKRGWVARSWDPDDPRVADLASALADNLLANRALLAIAAASFQARPDFAARYGLINYHREDQMPAAARLTELVDARLRAAGVDVPYP